MWHGACWHERGHEMRVCRWVLRRQDALTWLLPCVQLLAQILTRLLRAGPLVWDEPLFLLVAYALQHPQAPYFVDHFHLVVQLCVDGDSEANVYCLSSAMRAAARGGDQLVSSAMAGGKPFDEISNIKFYASEDKELEQTRDVLPAIAQALEGLCADSECREGRGPCCTPGSHRIVHCAFDCE